MRYFVYLRRGPPPSADALVRVLGLSRADSDRIAKARVPQPVAVCGSADEARERVAALNREGLTAFAVTPQALRRFQPRLAARVEPARGGLLWDDEVLGPDDVRMIVVGRFRWEVRAEAEVARYSESSSASEESGFLCAIRGPDDARLIVQRECDVVRLLERPPLTSDALFLAAARAVRAAYPKALYDDTLYRTPAPVRGLLSAASYGSDEGEIVTARAEAAGNRPWMLRMACLLYLRAFSC